MAKNLYDMLKHMAETRGLEYMSTDFRSVLDEHDEFHNFVVHIPYALQDVIGKMLFYHTKDNEFYGHKTGEHTNVQIFRLFFTDKMDKFHISFYLPLSNNWEEYVFTIGSDGDISDSEVKIPTNIEKRTMPDKVALLDAIRESAETYIKHYNN